MNLRFLETFIWVARLRSFSLAAEKVLASQAGVSARIVALERELGVRLFQRDTREVRLTAEGMAALEQAEVIVRQVAELRAKIADPSLLRGSLRIGVIDTIVCTWLPGLLEQAQRRFPRLRIDIRTDTSVNLARALTQGDIDLGLLIGPVTGRGVITIDLCTYGCQWVASPSLGLHRQPHRLGELGEVRLLSYSEDSAPHAAMLQLVRAHGASASRIFTSNSLATTIRLAVDGLGVAALPEAAIERNLRDGELVRLTLAEPFPPIAMHAAWLDDPGNPLPGIVAAAAQSIATGFCAGREPSVARHDKEIRSPATAISSLKARPRSRTLRVAGGRG
jgi:DNA-binding transcriptional LysR family regulator